MEIKDRNEPKEVTIELSYSPIYSRVFDDQTSNYWELGKERNLFFVRYVESHMTSILRGRGYLFLNEVYRVLGLKETKTGTVCGWVYDKSNPIGDNEVIIDVVPCENSNGLILDFNVDGCIINRI